MSDGLAVMPSDLAAGAAIFAAAGYADTSTSARISVDGLREEWATASKQLTVLVDLGNLPGDELAIVQAQADKLRYRPDELPSPVPVSPR